MITYITFISIFDILPPANWTFYNYELIVHPPSSTENEMLGMNSCSTEFKGLEPDDVINKERLVHSGEYVIKQGYNYLFGVLIEKEELS